LSRQRQKSSLKSLPLVLVGLLIIAGFAAGRFLAAAPSVTADPDDAQGQEVQRLLAEDGAKARFSGGLNGFTFGGSVTATDLSPKCKGSLRDGDEKDIGDSDLSFEVKYLPLGASLKTVRVTICDDEVVLITQQYDLQTGGFLQITRRSGPAVYPAAVPEDRLKVATFAGRASVIAEPALPLDRQAIYMRDRISTWQLVSMQLSLNALTEVAEGVVSK
jgi:hypothetical protein